MRNTVIVAASIGALALVGCGGAAARPAPAVTVTQTATAPAPTVTRTATVHVTQTATVAPPALTVARYSGTRDWNSPQFTVAGDNPVLTVKYAYSGNILPGETSGDNFTADLTNGSDDQSIANEIGTSGGATTTLYPDTSGGNAYHLTVTATGSWSVTITEAG